MAPRKIMLLICVLGSALCLAIGYRVAGNWIGATIAILIVPAWWFARKYPASLLPLACLMVSIGCAVVGRLIGSPALLMIFGSALALAAWDLVLLDSALGNTELVAQTRQYENKHLQSLMLALGCGVLVTLLGRFLNIQMPFLVLMLFITFMLFALDRVWGSIKKTGRP